MFTHYYASKAQKIVIITDTPSIQGGKSFKVAGKAEAKKVAKEHNAKPWNF